MKYIITLLFLFVAINSFSKIEYSIETKKTCTNCHVNADGGELTTQGDEFKKTLIKEGRYVPIENGTKITRAILGFIHFLTAFLWFGTILYVHLILKPKYIAKGIPLGELKIGWISMLIMLTTGIYLTIQKFPTLDSLFSTEIGILLLIKIALFTLMIITIFIVTFYIAPKIKSKIKDTSVPEIGDLTREQLSYFDGKEGRPAFIGYKGKIYDVTVSVFWYNGNHVMQHVAGMDLTMAMSLAPHANTVLNGFIVVGDLIKDSKTKAHPFMRLFYILAYGVLVCVFTIIIILSMWKWWYY